MLEKLIATHLTDRIHLPVWLAKTPIRVDKGLHNAGPARSLLTTSGLHHTQRRGFYVEVTIRRAPIGVVLQEICCSLTPNTCYAATPNVCRGSVCKSTTFSPSSLVPHWHDIQFALRLLSRRPHRDLP
jgi:hypothetical protein